MALPKSGKSCKYREALLTTLFALGGIYASFFVLIFTEDGRAFDELLQAQSLLGAIFVNLFAVVGVAYSKFAKEIFVHKDVYWTSMASVVTIVSIFAQANAMKDSTVTLVFDWIESPCVSVVLQILLAILIFKIAAQKELDVRVSYNRKELLI